MAGNASPGRRPALACAGDADHDTRPEPGPPCLRARAPYARCALRRADLHRRHLHRDLLPSGVPGAGTQGAQRGVFRHRRLHCGGGLRPACAAAPSWHPAPLPGGRATPWWRALRLIEQGRSTPSPSAVLAARAGVGERHLRRLFAETARCPRCRSRPRGGALRQRLLSDTACPSPRWPRAGYASVRRFNAAFRAAYGPGQLRAAP